MNETGHRIADEFSEVCLGDKRLERRLMRIADWMQAAPEQSLVEQSGDVAALEATYRFFCNEKVVPEAIFDGHAQKTAERAWCHESVLVLHDTTEFRFGGDKVRKGLGRISTDKRDGFLAHYSLCVSMQGEPLGSLQLHAWSRLEAADSRPKSKGDKLDPDRESQRWSESVQRCAERLKGKTSAVHVMDREGDQFELFAMLLEQRQPALR